MCRPGISLQPHVALNGFVGLSWIIEKYCCEMKSTRLLWQRLIGDLVSCLAVFITTIPCWLQDALWNFLVKKVSPHIQCLGMSLAQYQRRGSGCRSGLRSVYGQFDCFFGGRCTCEFQLPTAATGATSQPTGGLACDAKRKVFLVKYSFNSPLSVSSHHSNSAAKRAPLFTSLFTSNYNFPIFSSSADSSSPPLTNISLVRGCALISYFLSSSSLTSSLSYFIWVSLCQNVFGAKLFIRELEGNQRDWPVCVYAHMLDMCSCPHG